MIRRNDPAQSTGRWAQPWLTDIAFDQGDMILALRDRNGDQFGIAAAGPDWGSESILTQALT